MDESKKKEIQNAYINYHSPWIDDKEKEYYWKEIVRLCNKYYE